MNWKEKRHAWALEYDGQLWGTPFHRTCMGIATELFATKREALYVGSTFGELGQIWKPVKVEVTFKEI